MTIRRLPWLLLPLALAIAWPFREPLVLAGIDAVLLTHLRSDHIDGLGELAMLRWVNADYRHAHHGAGVAPRAGAARDGPVTVGMDGSFSSLPAGSRELIEHPRRR